VTKKCNKKNSFSSFMNTNKKADKNLDKNSKLKLRKKDNVSHLHVPLSHYRWKKMYIKLYDFEKEKEEKNYFRPDFFLSESCVPLYFLVALFPPPSFHKFLCSWLKRKEFLFSTLPWKKDKIDLHNNTAKSIRGISTKMLDRKLRPIANLYTK